MLRARVPSLTILAVVVLAVSIPGMPAIAGAKARQSYSPVARLSPSQAHPQQSNVDLIVNGFRPDQRLTVAFGTAEVATARSNAAGRATVRITVPASAKPGPHEISVSDSGQRAHTDLIVRTNWAMSGFDAGNTANNRFENVATPKTAGSLSEEWNTGSIPAGSQIGSPAVYDGTVYLGEWENGADTASELAINASTGQVSTLLPNDGSTWAPTITGDEMIFSGLSGLVAYSLQGGQALWSLSAAGGGAVLENGVLYSGGSGDFYALDPATGDVLWTIPVPVALQDQPIAVDGDMAFGSSGDELVAINLITESIAWTATAPDSWAQLTRPTAADGVVVVGGDGVFAYDETTGQELWSASTDLGAQGMVANGIIYTFTPGGDGLEARDLQTGDIQWSVADVGGPVALAGGVLYTHELGLGAIDATTGAVLWSQNTDVSWGQVNVPAVANGVVFDPSQSLGLTAFTPSGG
jgi:outer membrane protein assembly factor BamB